MTTGRAYLRSQRKIQQNTGPGKFPLLSGVFPITSLE